MSYAPLQAYGEHCDYFSLQDAQYGSRCGDAGNRLVKVYNVTSYKLRVTSYK